MGLRLINTETRALETFANSPAPPYAVLSHTWQPGQEITLQELQDFHTEGTNLDYAVRSRPGLEKILKTCERAKTEGLSFCWVDTCCIDKTSSSELSEAINSMFQWYRNAKICYVLLSDYEVGAGINIDALNECRWFTRGWCLQELIAPQQVELFDRHWNSIGSRTSLAPLISSITNIPTEILAGQDPLDKFPTARKLSWAANRSTTREEDIAYCLLGLLNINMPILYGEGAAAFVRLQEEIVKRSNDLSLFARNTSDSSRRFESMLGTSPKDYVHCGNLVHSNQNCSQTGAYTLTNMGLHFTQVELQIDPHLHPGLFILRLNCETSGGDAQELLLRQVGPSLYAKCLNRSVNQSRDESDMFKRTRVQSVVKRDIYIVAQMTTSIEAQILGVENYAIHASSTSLHLRNALQVAQRSFTSDRWDISEMRFITRGLMSFSGYWKFFPHRATKFLESSKQQIFDPPHCFIFCGLEMPKSGLTPKAWVYMVSPEEWRELEKKYGVIDDLGEVLGTLESTHARAELGIQRTSTSSTMLVAHIAVDPAQKRVDLSIEMEQ